MITAVTMMMKRMTDHQHRKAKEKKGRKRQRLPRRPVKRNKQ